MNNPTFKEMMNLMPQKAQGLYYMLQGLKTDEDRILDDNIVEALWQEDMKNE